MLCTNCGEIIGENAIFCKYCGTKINAVPPGFYLDEESGLYYYIEKRQGADGREYWEIIAYDIRDGIQFSIYPTVPVEGEDGSPRGYRYDPEEQMYYHTLRLFDEEQGQGVLVSYIGTVPDSAGQEFVAHEESPRPPLQNFAPPTLAQPLRPELAVPPSTGYQLRPAPPPPPLPPGAILLESGQSGLSHSKSNRTAVTAVSAVVMIVAALAVGAWQFGLFSSDGTPIGSAASLARGTHNGAEAEQVGGTSSEALGEGQGSESNTSASPANATVLKNNGHSLTVPDPLLAHNQDGSVNEAVSFLITECYPSGAGFVFQGEIASLSNNPLSFSVRSCLVDIDGNEADASSVFSGEITLEPGESKPFYFTIGESQTPDSPCMLKMVLS